MNQNHNKQSYDVTNGDVLEVLKSLPANSYDGGICDPPYGLGFMGKDWDQNVPSVEVWEDMLRVCKPGAYLLTFGSPKTFHRLACHIEDAGWEIRDTLCWLYGEGFPKSQDFSKGISQYCSHGDLVKRFRGRGTTLKPAWEPIVLAMKPTCGSYAKNAAIFGCGGLDIDGSRIGSSGGRKRSHQAPYPRNEDGREDRSQWARSGHAVETIDGGRWPANVMLDEDAAAVLDEQSGPSRSRRGRCGLKDRVIGNGRTMNTFVSRYSAIGGYDDKGGASRFFYVAKASKEERQGIDHPAVKPLRLCEHLAGLVLPPERRTARRLLVPYSGSGSEMLGALKAGWDHIHGIEKDEQYRKTSLHRLAKHKQEEAEQDVPAQVRCEPPLKINSVVQGDCAKTIPRLPDQSVNLGLCSPPYANQRKRMYPGVSERDFPAFTVKWMAKLWEKLTDDGSVLMVIRPHLRKGVISDYVLRTRLALRKFGWHECEELIWYKPDGGGFQGSNRRPRRAYENILWFSKTHNPFIDTKACGGWSNEISSRGSTRFGMGSDLPIHTGQNTEKRSGRTRVSDVFTVPMGTISKGVMHPAMFPQPLAEKLIKTFCPEGGTVLDCFAGSGTTLLAAQATGRHFYGIDVMQKYVDIARSRLEEGGSQAA